MEEYWVEMKIKRKDNDHFVTIDKYFGTASSAFTIIRNKYLGVGALKKLDKLLIAELEELYKR